MCVCVVGVYSQLPPPALRAGGSVSGSLPANKSGPPGGCLPGQWDGVGWGGCQGEEHGEMHRK